MILSYKTVKSQISTELNIKKSRFIAHVAPVDTEEKAQAFVEQIQTKFSDATHNVFAYRAGLQADIKKQSDDGEPSGTAGKPVLDVIENQGLQNLAIVVTRYFGGIKLGAGGLVRAYSSSAKEGVEAAGVVTRHLYREMEIEITYSQLGKIQNQVEEYPKWSIRDSDFQANVKMVIAIPYHDEKKFIGFIENLTAGQGKIIELGQMYLT